MVQMAIVLHAGGGSGRGSGGLLHVYTHVPTYVRAYVSHYIARTDRESLLRRLFTTMRLLILDNFGKCFYIPQSQH